MSFLKAHSWSQGDVTVSRSSRQSKKTTAQSEMGILLPTVLRVGGWVNSLNIRQVILHPSPKSATMTWTFNQAVRFKRAECHCTFVCSLCFFLPPLTLPHSFTFKGSLPALLAGPISSGFCTFQSMPLCPSEADALNKMTTVICFCHSGPGADYIAAQKYSVRESGRFCVCVSAGSDSLFFLFSRELPFPLSLRWQVYLKPAMTPPLIHTALQDGEK